MSRRSLQFRIAFPEDVIQEKIIDTTLRNNQEDLDLIKKAITQRR